MWRAKSPTTPGAIGEGVIDAARLAAERRGEPLETSLSKVARFGLGTTVVTNVLASRTALPPQAAAVLIARASLRGRC